LVFAYPTLFRSDVDLIGLAGRQVDACLLAARQLFERDRGGDVEVLATRPLRLPRLRATAREAAENLADDVVAVERIAGARAAACRRPAEGAPTAGAGARASGALAETLETLEARLALGVDLAAVELGALVLVADDLIGGVDFGEAFLRLRISLVLVRMVLLGELAEGLLDLGRARIALHTQNLIRVSHDSGQ